ncbi:hypothetical protein BV22DRAFT_1045133 [Leucogyrophana mollusca]|uniref:Uncharacterized protein n=1 Tax=Leucogyrophana mollusca TaxID=85980 RepID=A0ACB8BPE2_9AGAM|nr:hypothetical protein BV22DRAFT_1045133 [Leucogyrophana mollusca]
MHNTLWAPFIAFLATTTFSFANDSAGDCKFAGESDFFSWDHTWDFAIYSSDFCGGEQLRYHGASSLSIGCKCVSLPMESDVYGHWKKMRIHSFVFTARAGQFKAIIHDELNCDGNVIVLRWGTRYNPFMFAQTGHNVPSVAVPVSCRQSQSRGGQSGARVGQGYGRVGCKTRSRNKRAQRMPSALRRRRPYTLFLKFRKIYTDTFILCPRGRGVDTGVEAGEKDGFFWTGTFRFPSVRVG